MTKKDYELIAQAIKKAQMGVKLDNGTIRAIVYTLADDLKGKNPKFQRDKFIFSCGLFEF